MIKKRYGKIMDWFRQIKKNLDINKNSEVIKKGYHEKTHKECPD